MATHNVRIMRMSDATLSVSFTRGDGRTEEVLTFARPNFRSYVQGVFNEPSSPHRSEVLSSSAGLAKIITQEVMHEYMERTSGIPFSPDRLFWVNLVAIVPELRYFSGYDSAEVTRLVLERLNERDPYGRVIYPSDDVCLLEDNLVLVVGKKVPYQDISIPVIKE